jgi:nucleoside-diphosphate-sugar epimerase
MKRVLITGASGFLGRQCVPLLPMAGYEVHAVARKTLEAAEPDTRVHWHRADLLDASQASELISMIQPSHLLHLAWYSVPGKFWTSLENFRWLQASLDLVRAFADCGGERIVAAGSCAEYSWENQPILSERSTPVLPGTVYGACKHALHTVLEAFTRQSHLSLGWGRVFFLYGPHEHPDRLTASVIQSLLRGETAHCSDGRQVRDFLYVGDAAAALVALLRSEVSGPINIASGEGVAVKDVIDKIGALIGRRDLIRLGDRNKETAEPPVLVADVKRLHDEVGFRPQQSLDTGLRLSTEWWRRRIEKGGS